jgi:RNA polymerase sigma-70 factor, ECF subfamily
MTPPQIVAVNPVQSAVFCCLSEFELMTWTTSRWKERHDVGEGTACDPDRRLIERAREDPTAFGALYDRYFPRVYAYVAHRVGRPADAEDLVAETFFRALRGMGRFEDRGAGSFAAWLFRIAHNLAADHAIHPSQADQLPLLVTFDRPDGRPSPDDIVLDRERAAQLHQLVRTLSPRRQEIVTLKFFGGLRNREIAAILGLDERTVSAHLCRALDDLRETYQESVGAREEGGSR